jgi:HEAT repeat protein
MRRSLLLLFPLLFAGFVLAFQDGEPTEKKDFTTKKDLPKGALTDLFEKVPGVDEKKETKPADPAEVDRDLLRENHLEPTEARLLAFFRTRSLTDAELPKIEALARELGEESFREREDATRALLKRGPAVADYLRKIMQGDDLEAARRAEKCLAILRDSDVSPEVRAAAVRALGRLDAIEKVPVLLGFFPYSDHDMVGDEVRRVLTAAAAPGGRPHPALVAALKDPVAARRGLAGEVLARTPSVRAEVTALLKDADPTVRIRVAQGLVVARVADAVPVLIDAVPEVASSQAWDAKDLLLRLGEGKSPPMLAVGADAAARKKYRDAWLDWWEKNRSTVDLARLEKKSEYLGRTVCVLLDQNQIIEMNQAKEILWKLENIGFPLDLQVLPTGNILIAEYQAGRVTERDSANNIHWSKEVSSPLMAQRVGGGRTFVATDSSWHEFDREGNETSSGSPLNGERMMKVARMPNGNIVALTVQPRIVWFDPRGKELSSFPLNLEAKLFGGRLEVLPNGRVLVPFNMEDKVVEFDQTGKQLWSVSVPRPVAAVRLANGHTLVTSMLPETGAVEFDGTGREVWSYQSPTDSRVTRALRR